MSYRRPGLLMMIAVAVISALTVSTAQAVPYEWRISEIQGLADVTASFHGGAGQLSTINSITPIANGVELNVTYRIGQEVDPFGADYGLGFARVSLAGGLGFPGLNLSAYSSSKLKVTTTTDLTVQSFIQTDFTEGGSVDDGDANPGEAFSFLFWEHNDGVAAGTTDVDFDFASGTEFDGNWGVASPQPVQGTGAIRAWGLQLAKFSGMAIGQPITATIRLEGVVPEPSCVALAGLALCGVLGVARRRS